MSQFVTLKDILLISPMIALCVASLIPIMTKVFKGNREPNPFATLMWAFMGLLTATGLTVTMAGAKQTAFSSALVFDGVTVWISYLVYLITAVSLMLAFDNCTTRGKQFAEFVFLTLCSAIGMLILVMSNDLIVTFIGIETMSLALYILVAMSKEETLSKEAAMKYFVLGSFSSAIFLYGTSFIYGSVGGTYFPMIAQNAGVLLGTNRLFLLGMAMVILGFAFKVSIFPFHAWTPDVYQGAPTPVTAFMSTAVKASTFVAFLRLFKSEGYANSVPLEYVMQWLAVLTMIVGNVAALMQDNFKRVLAYSSVAHSGYIMVGLIAAAFGNNFNGGATGTLFYLFSYSLMTLGSFALISLFEKYENTHLNVSDLKGLATKYPVLALSLAVLMLSLAGIPPTLGFFGKFYIFSAAVEQDMYWLVIWGVLNSAVSVYYYLRPVVMMYMSDDQPAEVMTTHFMTRVTVVASAILIVVFGIFSAPFLRAVQQSVISFFG